jgi:hypothetical protein
MKIIIKILKSRKSISLFNKAKEYWAVNFQNMIILKIW